MVMRVHLWNRRNRKGISSMQEKDLISSDINAYIAKQAAKDTLRFITCGSVDDGKSTLIGRLLYESKMIFDDQLSALQKDSSKFGTQSDEIDFALLVDVVFEVFCLSVVN